MKKFRKIMAILVAAMMIMATMVPAWADGDTGTRDKTSPDTGTITIYNAEDGETYTAYRIFDLYSFVDNEVASNAHDVDKEHYAYMIDASSPWYPFVAKYAEFTDINNQHSNAGTAGADYIYFTIDNANPYVDGNNTTGTDDDITYYFVSSKDRFDFVKRPTTNIQVPDETADPYSSRYDSDNTDSYVDGWLTGTDGFVDYNTVQKFAREARVWAETAANNVKRNNAQSVPYYETKIASTEGSDHIANKVTVTFSNLPLGYYLVDSSIGSMVALDTTNKAVTMYDKNLIPSLKKYVKVREKDDESRNANGIYDSDDFDSIWVKNTDYEIGATVKFMNEITAPKGARNYVLHDVMEKGFTVDASTIVVYYAQTGENFGKMTTATAGTHYTLVSSPTDNCTFEIKFDKDDFWSLLPDNAIIQVEYSAKLNKDAVIKFDTETPTTPKTTIGTTSQHLEGDPVDLKGVEDIFSVYNDDGKNTNSAILTFGNASSTDWSVATVETYQFDLVKTKEDYNNDTVHDLLDGAVFELYKANKNATTGNNEPASPNETMSNNKVSFIVDGNKYQVFDGVQTGTTVTDITTLKAKALNIRGLEAGTYFLKEKTAPTGFQILDGYYKIVIEANNTDGTSKATAGDLSITYVNRSNVGTPVTRKWHGYITEGTGEAASDTAGIYDSDLASIMVEGTSTAITQGGIHIENKTTTELPSTGGMGTTVLYIVGGMLVILAGAYLFFSRKRMA